MAIGEGLRKSPLSLANLRIIKGLYIESSAISPVSNSLIYKQLKENESCGKKSNGSDDQQGIVFESASEHFEWGRPISAETMIQTCLSSEARDRYANVFPNLTEAEIDEILNVSLAGIENSNVLSFYPVLVYRALKEHEKQKKESI